MHVLAYIPVEFGVQDIEKRGVLVDEKKFIAIESIPINLDVISASTDTDIVSLPNISVVML